MSKPIKNIRLFKAFFGIEEFKAVKKIYKKSWIGFGPEVKEFDMKF